MMKNFLVSNVTCLGYGMELTLNNDSVLHQYYDAGPVFMGIRSFWDGNHTIPPIPSNCFTFANTKTLKLPINYNECDLHVIRVVSLTYSSTHTHTHARAVCDYLAVPLFFENSLERPDGSEVRALRKH